MNILEAILISYHEIFLAETPANELFVELQGFHMQRVTKADPFWLMAPNRYCGI